MWNEQGTTSFSSANSVPFVQPIPNATDRSELERTVAGVIAGRRRRAVHFSAELFSDPAWDILLHVMLAECRFQRMSISRLVRAAELPMATTIRWIARLVEEGLIVRREDMNDKRRVFIELSSRGFEAMSTYCSRQTPSAA